MIVTASYMKKLRIDAELTQRELADLVGISQAHIAKIENQKVDPRLSTVNRILQVLTEGEGRKCKDVMTTRVFSAQPDDTIETVSRIMMREGISQLPIIHENRIIGTITEESIIRNLHDNIANESVKGIMDAPLPCVPDNTNMKTIRELLKNHPGVLIIQKGKGDIIGIITRSDLLKTVQH